MSLADIVAMARKSVVKVETPGGQGTGIVVSAGAILTNAHVVAHESAGWN
jgi:V8-like Glu-specific endopeptidase